MIKIFFIGLSNKIKKEPLSSETVSGALIDRIINNLEYKCIKANLVNFSPLNQNCKLRYPNIQEQNKGFESLKLILEKNTPYIAVCLGKKVSRYLDSKVDNPLKIKHPAHMAVYKRKEVNLYIKNTVDNINSMVLNTKHQKPLQNKG